MIVYLIIFILVLLMSVLALVIAGRILLFRYYRCRRSRKRIPFALLIGYVDDLRRRDFDGGRMIIQQWGTDEFFQFIKKIPKGLTANVTFGFPIAEWSQKYIQILKKELNSRQIQYHIRQADRSLPQKWVPDYVKAVEEFVEVNCGIDLNRALLVKDIALKSMGLGKETQFDIIHFGPRARYDKVIGFEG